MVPFLLLKTGADQAAASAPFITTIKDITGLLIYFLLANILLTI
jgi:magnesium transporter